MIIVSRSELCAAFQVAMTPCHCSSSAWNTYLGLQIRNVEIFYDSTAKTAAQTPQSKANAAQTAPNGQPSGVRAQPCHGQATLMRTVSQQFVKKVTTSALLTQASGHEHYCFFVSWSWKWFFICPVSYELRSTSLCTQNLDFPCPHWKAEGFGGRQLFFHSHQSLSHFEMDFIFHITCFISNTLT